jgi:hypothetical protein
MVGLPNQKTELLRMASVKKYRLFGEKIQILPYSLPHQSVLKLLRKNEALHAILLVSLSFPPSFSRL